VFHQLTKEQIIMMVDLMIGRVEKQLKAKDMELELTGLAKGLLAKRGFDPVLGARPLRRTIQREIEDQLSEKILFGEVEAGQIILVDVEAGPARRTTRASRPASPSVVRSARRPSRTPARQHRRLERRRERRRSRERLIESRERAVPLGSRPFVQVVLATPVAVLATPVAVLATPVVVLATGESASLSERPTRCPERPT